MGRAARNKWEHRKRPALLDRSKAPDVHQRIQDEGAAFAAQRAAALSDGTSQAPVLERSRFPALEELIRTAGSAVFLPKPAPFMHEGRVYWGRVRGPVELEVFADQDDASPIAAAIVSNESIAAWIRRRTGRA